MDNEPFVNDAAVRFASQVEDAKRGLAAETNSREDDEPYDPIRAIFVNSLCFLIPIVTLMGAWIYSVPGFVGVTLITIGCIKILRSKDLARWVINGAIFFLTGVICSVLFVILAVPFTVIMAKAGTYFVS